MLQVTCHQQQDSQLLQQHHQHGPVVVKPSCLVSRQPARASLTSTVAWGWGPLVLCWWSRPNTQQLRHPRSLMHLICIIRVMRIDVFHALASSGQGASIYWLLKLSSQWWGLEEQLLSGMFKSVSKLFLFVWCLQAACETASAVNEADSLKSLFLNDWREDCRGC